MGTPIKSHGTELYWASAATTATRAVAVTSISGLGGAKDQIETTTLDDTSDKTYVAGLGNPGQVSIGFVVHSGESSHEDLLALKDAGTSVSWGIYGSESATAPTASGSAMQTVATRSSAIFSGYVSDINIDMSEGDVWKGTITIQRSGTVSFDLLVGS